MNPDLNSEQPENNGNNIAPVPPTNITDRQPIVLQPNSSTQMSGNVVPVMSQEPQQAPAQVLSPQVTIPQLTPLQSVAQPVMSSAGQPAAVLPPKDEEKTLSMLHKHEHPASLIVIAAIICFSLFNISWGLHVRTARHVAYNQLPQVQAQLAQSHFGPVIESRTNGILDMTRKVNNLLTSKNQYVVAGLNQQVNLYDGISFIVTGIQRNWHSEVLGTLPPDPGNYYIKLDMVVGNRNVQQWGLNIVQSEALINGRQLTQIIYFPLAGSAEFGNDQNDLSSDLSELESGQTISGALVIQVPNNSLPDLLIQDQSYTYTNQSVILKARVKL